MLNGPVRLQGKLSLLVAGSLAIFLAMLLVVRLLETRALDEAQRALRRVEERQYDRWLEIFNRPLQEMLLDLAPWSETRAFLARPQADWARQHLAAALADRQLEAVWLVRADGHVAYAGQRERAEEGPALPAPADLAEATAGGRAQFFAPGGAAGPWQYQLAPVNATDGSVAGWLMVARRWDAARLEQLAALADCEVRLEPAPPAGWKAERAAAGWRRTLSDVNGWPVGDLVFAPKRAPAAAASDLTWPMVALFVAFGALLLAALWLATNRWVLRPLQLIADSLRDAAPERVAPLLRQADEFRPVAALVRESFAQRAALESEIADRRRAEEALRVSQESLRHSVELRARLARDLHDHVIQSIYAAGLGLDSARAQMSVDPFGVEGRIRDCMENLNDTIRQVRGYINDLEPDATGERQQFAEAVRALTATMHRLWPVKFELQLDDAGGRLTNLVEIHALQIVRESISNAVRHGRATRIAIALTREADATVLRVRDNGCGFDPVERMGTGRGLVNLSTRAREMGATFQLDSQPGAGAVVTVRMAARAEARS